MSEVENRLGEIGAQLDSTVTSDLARQLGQLNVMQLVALTKQLEADWGVSATPQQLGHPGETDNVSQVTEQTEFTISLVSYPADKKMSVVKMVREQLGLGLLESKTLVEAAPKVLKEAVSKEEAEALRAKFTEAGAVVTVQ